MKTSRHSRNSTEFRSQNIDTSTTIQEEDSSSLKSEKSESTFSSIHNNVPVLYNNENAHTGFRNIFGRKSQQQVAASQYQISDAERHALDSTLNSLMKSANSCSESRNEIINILHKRAKRKKENAALELSKLQETQQKINGETNSNRQKIQEMKHTLETTKSSLDSQNINDWLILWKRKTVSFEASDFIRSMTQEFSVLIKEFQELFNITSKENQIQQQNLIIQDSTNMIAKAVLSLGLTNNPTVLKQLSVHKIERGSSQKTLDAIYFLNDVIEQYRYDNNHSRSNSVIQGSNSDIEKKFAESHSRAFSLILDHRRKTEQALIEVAQKFIVPKSENRSSEVQHRQSIQVIPSKMVESRKALFATKNTSFSKTVPVLLTVTGPGQHRERTVNENGEIEEGEKTSPDQEEISKINQTERLTNDSYRLLKNGTDSMKSSFSPTLQINSEKQLTKSSPSLNQGPLNSLDNTSQSGTLKKSMFGSIRRKKNNSSGSTQILETTRPLSVMAEENSNITSPPPVTNTSQNSKERTSSNTPVITKTALLSTPLNIGTNINSEKQLAKSSPSLNQESSSSNEQSRQNSTLKKSMFGSLRRKNNSSGGSGHVLDTTRPLSVMAEERSSPSSPSHDNDNSQKSSPISFAANTPGTSISTPLDIGSNTPATKPTDYQDMVYKASLVHPKPGSLVKKTSSPMLDDSPSNGVSHSLQSIIAKQASEISSRKNDTQHESNILTRNNVKENVLVGLGVSDSQSAAELSRILKNSLKSLPNAATDDVEKQSSPDISHVRPKTSPHPSTLISTENNLEKDLTSSSVDDIEKKSGFFSRGVFGTLRRKTKNNDSKASSIGSIEVLKDKKKSSQV